MLTRRYLMHEHQITAAACTALGEDALERFFRRLTRRVGEIQCGMTGHNVMLRYEPARLSLQCTTCGYESPGWELAPARPPRSLPSARLSRPIAV
jgi:hypothetical protein